MTTRKRVLKGATLLGAGKVLGELMRFARNVFVARILTPEDYGLAATFWITTGLLTTVTEFGFRQRLIQARDGDDERVCAVAQSLFLLRSLAIAIVLFVAAGPISHAFDAPETRWAFQLLALLPIIGGFAHCDLDRVQRNLEFFPAVLAKLVPEVVVTILAVPIALATRDYSAFLYLSLISISLNVVVSHLLAERPFRILWDREIVGQFMGFGWPLLLNGLLMYAVLQGDRVILVAAYTKADLGSYSVACTLVIAMLGVATGVIKPVVLPLMARAQDDREAFVRHYQLHAQAIGAISAAIAVACILVGPIAVVVLYGPRYELAATVIGYLGISHAVRLLRSPAANAAMARGDTKNMMYANVVRQLGLGLAVVAAVYAMPIAWIALTGIVGEIAALCATVSLLKHRHALPPAALMRPAIFVAACVLVAIALVHWSPVSNSWASAFVAFMLFAILAALTYVGLFQSIRAEIHRAWRSIVSRTSPASSPT